MPKRSSRTANPTGVALFPPADRPTPPGGFFAVPHRYEWIECELEGFEGFAIYVRTSITNAEQRILTEQHDEIVTYYDTFFKLPPEDRDYSDGPREREKVLMAPLIVDWNAKAINAETGELELMEPPSVAGPGQLDAIYDEMVNWMLRTVLGGYVLTGKAVAWKPRRERGGTTPETPADPEPSPSSPDPSSATPSESTSTTSDPGNTTT